MSSTVRSDRRVRPNGVHATRCLRRVAATSDSIQGPLAGRPRPAPTRSQPRVALVLNGGAAPATSSLGVLRVLAEVVTPHCVVGKSAGALIALMLARGYTPEEMVSLLKKELAPCLLRLVPGGSYVNMARILRGRHLVRRLAHYCPPNLRLEELWPRLLVACTDLVQQKCVLLESGPAIELVAASCSLPGFGVPFMYGEMVLVDGGVASPGLSRIREHVDADLVIGVAVAAAKKSCVRPGQKPGLVRTVLQSRAIRKSCRPVGYDQDYDLIIAPDTPFGFADLHPGRIDRLVEAGVLAAEAELPRLEALIRQTLAPKE